MTQRLKTYSDRARKRIGEAVRRVEGMPQDRRGSGSPPPPPFSRPVFPARITSVANVSIDHASYGKMAWEQVRWNPEADDGDGGTAAKWETVEGGRSGEINEPTHAREINGRPMVAPGTIVLMTAVAGGYWFSMDSGPTYEQLGDLAVEQYQTTDFDAEDSGNAWFDRDHVHHGGPTSRYDPESELVEMPGSHSEGWARAWFARFVNFLSNPDEDDPNEAEFEAEHHDNIIELERRLIHGDPGGHFQWVGPAGESEVGEGEAPKVLVRHKDPDTTEWRITLEDDEENVIGEITFDGKGHYNFGNDKTITISGVAGPAGDDGVDGADGADGDPADITIAGHSPWIQVAGSNTPNVTITHDGPGPNVALQDFVAAVALSGQNPSTTGATLGTSTAKLSKDLFGHTRDVEAVGGEDDEVRIPQVLGDLGDVDGAPSEGDVLVYSSGQWSPVTPEELDVVTDVSLSGGELKQTKRTVKVLPDVGAGVDSQIIETEDC